MTGPLDVGEDHDATWEHKKKIERAELALRIAIAVFNDRKSARVTFDRDALGVLLCMTLDLWDSQQYI